MTQRPSLLSPCSLQYTLGNEFEVLGGVFWECIYIGTHRERPTSANCQYQSAQSDELRTDNSHRELSINNKFHLSLSILLHDLNALYIRAIHVVYFYDTPWLTRRCKSNLDRPITAIYCLSVSRDLSLLRYSIPG